MAGRETEKERLEREHNELIQELRSLIPGAEVLFGFLLAIRFTGFFGELDEVQALVYFATLLATGLALLFFFAPAVFHRLRFREGDKGSMLKKGNREAIAGTLMIALALAASLFLVADLTFGRLAGVATGASFFALLAWRWWAIPVARNWQAPD